MEFNEQTPVPEPSYNSKQSFRESVLGRILAVPRTLKSWYQDNKKIAVIIITVIILGVSGGAFALYRLVQNSSSTGGAQTGDAATQNGSTQTANGTNKQSSPTTSQSGSNSSSSGSSSSTSGSTSTTPPNPNSFTKPIGFVGCSNSRDTVLGYRADAGTKMWVPTTNTYGGGTVTKWTDDNTYWSQFDQLSTMNPGTKVIWWSFCTYPPTKDNETDAANYASALSIINTLNSKIPGVTIYASALNTYVAPHVCSITGADGPSRMQNLVNQLVNEGRVKTGPVVGSLLSWESDGDPNNSAGATQSNDQTKSDGCHPNTVGEAFLGQSLINFFGK